MRQAAYLLDDVVLFSISEVCELVEGLIKDMDKTKRITSIRIPEIIKGQFDGYLNERNAPIGLFFTEDGRVFITDEDKVVIA